ncbi:unnamed protein product [Peniophora sp. CBMAI 1063]|nr:unnamed protein product [Peniophora sp. CBMAI 1063]
MTSVSGYECNISMLRRTTAIPLALTGQSHTTAVGYLPSRDTPMLRSPALSKPRASLPVGTTNAANRTTVLASRPRSANPSSTHAQSRLPTPSITQPTQSSALRTTRRRSSTLNDERTARSKPLTTSTSHRKAHEAVTADESINALHNRRGLVRASDTPTLSRNRSRTSPPRSVYTPTESYPTPPSSIGASVTRRTTYRAARTPTLAVRAVPTALAPQPRSRASAPSTTMPLKFRRRKQTAATSAVRWMPRSPSPGVLLLMEQVTGFQEEWARLFSDPVFERAWSTFLDTHLEAREKYVSQDEYRTSTAHLRPTPSRRLSVPTAKALSLRPTLGVEPDEDKILRRKSPVVDIFSMLSRDARPVGRAARLSSPPKTPLPDIPTHGVRFSQDSIISSTSNVRSSIATSISSRPNSARASYAESTTPSISNTAPGYPAPAPRQYLSSPSMTSTSQEAIASSDSSSSLHTVASTFTEISSSPPVNKSLKRNGMVPRYTATQLPTPPDELSPNPLGLIGVPHGYFVGAPVEDTAYSTNQAFTLTGSPLVLSPGPIESPAEKTPIGGNARGTSATSGSRSRQVTASLVNPYENRPSEYRGMAARSN